MRGATSLIQISPCKITSRPTGCEQGCVGKLEKVVDPGRFARAPGAYLVYRVVRGYPFATQMLSVAYIALPCSLTTVAILTSPLVMVMSSPTPPCAERDSTQPTATCLSPVSHPAHAGHVQMRKLPARQVRRSCSPSQHPRRAAPSTFTGRRVACTPRAGSRAPRRVGTHAPPRRRGTRARP